MQHSPFVLQEGPLLVVPVCHYRFEFAHYVRRAILSHRPSVVAVELPAALKEAYLEAVARFPYLSVIHYVTESGNSMVVPVEPTDPFAEAVRTAVEAGIPIHFVDLNVDDYPLLFDPMPDPYAVFRLGLQQYWQTYAEAHGERRRRAARDAARESHMAFEAKRLLGPETKDVMLICGMAHAAAVTELFRADKGERGTHSAIQSATVLDPDTDSIRRISAEMPFLIATYEFLRGGPGPDETWKDPPPVEEPPPRESPLEDLSQNDVMAALQSLLGMGKKDKPLNLPPEVLRALSKRLGSLQNPRLFLPLPGQGPAGAPTPESAPAANAKTHRIFKFKSCEERRSQLRGIYQACAQRVREADRMLDRQRTALRMLELAVGFYHENTGETFHRWQMRTLVRFARNYARLSGQLIPDFYKWIVSARGVSDDNYAYEVWDLGSFYPWRDESGRYKRIKMNVDEMWLDERLIRFRRRFPRFRERFVRPPTRSPGQEQEAGEWANDFRRGSICSYPPEDIVVEDYGRYLQKKAMLELSQERTRVEPFSSSMLDGIDVRETIRNWPDQHRVFVREMQKVSGGVGSVVVIFDEDQRDDRYPWKMTWHGEHEQESDMAFYSTPINAKIVGPGIARCEYGGLMLTYPPRRVTDVWSDPFYEQAQSKCEVLLMAALEYSKERHVVYVAAKPPRSLFRQMAARINRKIVYLPIGQMSPVSIKKIRVFHVLSGHQKREIAKDYIW